jgi:hypothetical protein
MLIPERRKVADFSAIVDIATEEHLDVSHRIPLE